MSLRIVRSVRKLSLSCHRYTIQRQAILIREIPALQVEAGSNGMLLRLSHARNLCTLSDNLIEFKET